MAVMIDRTLGDMAQEALLIDLLPRYYRLAGAAHLQSGNFDDSFAALAEGNRWAARSLTHAEDSRLGSLSGLLFALAGDYARAQSVPIDAGPETFCPEQRQEVALTRLLVAVGMLDHHGASELLDDVSGWADSGPYWWVAEHARVRMALYWGDAAAHIWELKDVLRERARSVASGTSAGMILWADLSDLYQSTGMYALSRAALASRASDQPNPFALTSTVRLDLLTGDFESARARLLRAEAGFSFPGGLIVLRDWVMAADKPGDPHPSEGVLRRIRRMAASDALVEVPSSGRVDRASAPAAGELYLRVPVVFPPIPKKGLSSRERQVLVAVGTHHSIAGAAGALHLSSNTIKAHLRSVYLKLGVHSQQDALDRVALDLAP